MWTMSRSLRITVALLLILGVVTVVAACGRFSPDTYWRSGKYVLAAVDTMGQMSLFVEGQAPMQSALVGPAVFSVGADDRHIVLKQHPSTDASGGFNRSVTNYFIVDKALGSSERQKAVRGPLNE